eukprot:07097.XXX_451333_451500_1 [CDS] Oithona nana genome sequencing.
MAINSSVVGLRTISVSVTLTGPGSVQLTNESVFLKEPFCSLDPNGLEASLNKLSG